MKNQKKFLTSTRHPMYTCDELHWQEWREVYEGGPNFVNNNLKKFSNRETEEDFKSRKFYTPIPSYAKSAINDIRNAIFQRLRDVYRKDGSLTYMKATLGELGGVDNRGASMQSFLGIDVLTELLVMGRVGVYVDMPQLSGFRTMADEGKARPYCYLYSVEDILSWQETRPEEPGEFSSILLRDTGFTYNQGFGNGIHLPEGDFVRYRLMWIDPTDRKVKMKLFNDEDEPIRLDGSPVIADETNGVVSLELERIPFTMLDIEGSLLKDVYKHQVALLNLGSSDVSYALKANYPFYTEQRDTRNVGAHLKKTVDDDGTTVTSDNSESGEKVRTGVTHGRAYDLKAKNAPQFIHPSPEPLLASMKLQEKLEDDIRKLVNLAVQNKTGQRAVSAEAMKLSDQGLEAGLSYIGLVLENAERRIATHWASYESKDPENRSIATIKYPDRYSLKDDTDRIEEAKRLSELMFTIPGKEIKKELAKGIVTTLLSGKTNTETLNDIFRQIEEASYATSDPEVIIKAQEAGLVGEQVASQALGFDEDEYLKARADHAERARRILEAQQSDMGSRGVKDLSNDSKEGSFEKKTAQEPNTKVDKKKRQRGEGKSLRKGE